MTLIVFIAKLDLLLKNAEVTATLLFVYFAASLDRDP